MIGPSGAVRVMVATRPVDSCKGAEGLAALVRKEIRADPFSGTVYVFRARRADSAKLIFWGGTGLCLVVKLLEDGRFQWPGARYSVMRLIAAQWSVRDYPEFRVWDLIKGRKETLDGTTERTSDTGSLA